MNAQLAAHDYDMAAHSLDELHACAALSDLELFEVGWLYGRARHFDAALKVFAHVPESVPDRATHFAIALSQFEMGDYASVAKRLATLSRLDLPISSPRIFLPFRIQSLDATPTRMPF